MNEMLETLAREISALKRQIAAMESRDEALRMLALVDGVTAPTAVAGLTFLYTDEAAGALKVRFGNGVTKTLATDT